MSTDVPAPRVRTARRRAIASLVAAGTVATTVAAVGTSGPSVEAAPGDTVQILSFNDFHGHIEPNTAGPINGVTGGPAGGGAEYLAAKLDELRTDFGNDANSFTVAAGDNIGGTPFFSGFFRDEPAVEALNAMGLDVSGVGNHEFDDGVAELLRMQNGGCFDTNGNGIVAQPAEPGTPEAVADCYFPDTPYAGADFDWIAANVIDDATGDPLELGADDLGGYTIEEVNGTKIAFIGMTLEGTDQVVSAAGIEGYTFADEVETANALIPEIKAAGAEAIFVLLHEGGTPTGPLAIDGCNGVSGPVIGINQGLSADIDALITGHTQRPYNCSLADPDGNNRPVVSAWEHGKVVNEMTFTLDDDGDVDRTTLSVVNHPVPQAGATPFAPVTAVKTKWEPLVAELRDEEVGRISENITRGGTPTGSNRGVESNAGNFVADAQLFGAQDFGLDADLALMNPGGVRSDLNFARSGAETEDGVVTFGEAFTFQPFGNYLTVVPMTGAQIKNVLLEQCQPNGSVLHLGVSDGFTYDLDIEREGALCTDVNIRNVRLDGVDIVDTTTYDVVANVFLADGGDNFTTFTEVAKTDREVGPNDVDALIAYLADGGDPKSAPGTDRVNETDILPTAVPVEPGRLLDTRADGTTVDGLFQRQGALAAGGVIELQVTGRGGVADDAESAVLNVGVIRPEALGFLSVYPCDEAAPAASNVNYAGGSTVSNAVFAKLSADGTACITSSVATNVYADVTSYVPVGGSPTAITPTRALDSRAGGVTADGLFQAGGPLAGGQILELDVVGRGLVPDDADAVVLNVGAIQPSANGYLTVFPCNATGTPPNASNVNYITGVNVANAVTVGIGDDGQVCIFTFASTNLIADVTGFVPANGSPTPIAPARLIDTRDDVTPVETIDGLRVGEGRLAAGEVVTLQVAGRGGVGLSATAADLNVTAVRPTGRGFLTVYPCTAERPLASQVNFAGSDNVANSVSALLADDGTVCIYSSVSTHLLVDVTGQLQPVTSTESAPIPV